MTPLADLTRTLGSALARYHRRHISEPRRARVVQAAASMLRPRLAAGASLLDVGCGDGRIARSLAAALGAGSVEGVDVLVQPNAAVSVQAYDGQTLPYPDQSVDGVLLSDVLHHAKAPQQLLAECVRVARRAVLVKDHFAYGPLSHSLLWMMDVAGNAESGVAVTGRYFSPAQWVDMVAHSGARWTQLCWPLPIHDLPWRLITRSELQFAAVLVPLTTQDDAAKAASDTSDTLANGAPA